jgi:hypothetical protein
MHAGNPEMHSYNSMEDTWFAYRIHQLRDQLPVCLPPRVHAHAFSAETMLFDPVHDSAQPAPTSTTTATLDSPVNRVTVSADGSTASSLFNAVNTEGIAAADEWDVCPNNDDVDHFGSPIMPGEDGQKVDVSTVLIPVFMHAPWRYLDPLLLLPILSTVQPYYITDPASTFGAGTKDEFLSASEYKEVLANQQLRRDKQAVASKQSKK